LQGITASDSKESQKIICKKTAALPQNCGKNHYFKTLNHPSRSTAWKYFTGDGISASVKTVGLRLSLSEAAAPTIRRRKMLILRSIGTSTVLSASEIVILLNKTIGGVS
jgi:hypothetical protein